MAQIKVLNLNDSCSLYELDDENTQKVSGGLAGAVVGIVYGLWNEKGLEKTLQIAANGAIVGGALAGPKGASLSTLA